MAAATAGRRACGPGEPVALHRRRRRRPAASRSSATACAPRVVWTRRRRRDVDPRRRGLGRRACTSCTSTTPRRRRGSSCAAAGGRSCSQLATNTWNAYNDVGGPNLYTGAVELSFARPLAPGMLAKDDDDAAPRRARATARSTRDQDADDVARHGRVGRPGAALRALGRGRGHRARATPRTPTSSSTPTCSTGAGCCSASATTSTGRGACATPSRRSSPAAATWPSCPATRATGRCASRAT